MIISDAYPQDLTFRVEHIPTELGSQGYASLVFFVNGIRIAHSDFASDSYTCKEMEDKKFSTVQWLMNNPHFSQYRPAFFRFFALRGITDIR